MSSPTSPKAITAAEHAELVRQLVPQLLTANERDDRRKAARLQRRIVHHLDAYLEQLRRRLP